MSLRAKLGREESGNVLDSKRLKRPSQNSV